MSTAIAEKRRLKLEIKQSGEESFVCCSGRLLMENTAQLKAEVKPLLATSKRVVLDLTHLEMMDSSGLGAVIGLYASAKAGGRDLKLINLNARIRELLGMTHVLGALTACGEYMIKTP